MNSLVFEYLKNSETRRPICALAHQVATVDIALKRINEKHNFLIAHYMGTGKTLTALCIALYVSKTRPVIFILPNSTVKENFIKERQRAITYMPLEEYRLDNITFETRTVFIEDFMISQGNKPPIINRLKARSYSNSLIVIDEAHMYFPNDWGQHMLELRREADNMQFLLLTGTPVPNTISTLQGLVHFVVDESVIIRTQSKGNKVVERTISNEDLDSVMERLQGLVSYYEQNPENNDVPEVRVVGETLNIFPVIECKMGKEQEDDYNKTFEMMMLNDKQDMFAPYASYASFACMGGYEHYSNFNTYLEQNTEVKLTRGLFLSNGLITGPWVRDMRWSCKMKRFLESLQEGKHQKRFAFFWHSKMGSKCIRSSMNSHGFTELGKEPSNNAICLICGLQRICTICVYARYVIVTSEEAKNTSDYIQNTLSIFNADSNRYGSDLMILFGSRIMAESHSLKEVRKVWILTVPDTHSYLFQTISRSVRTGAFDDTSEPIEVHILVATTSSSRVASVHERVVRRVGVDMPVKNGYKTLAQITYELAHTEGDDDRWASILEDNARISHDCKKLFYAEIKAKHGQIIMERIKDQTAMNDEPPGAEVVPLVLKSKLYHFCYDRILFTEKEFLEFAKDDRLFPESSIIEIFRRFVDDNVVVENRESGRSIIIRGNHGELVSLPVSESLDAFYHSVVYFDTERESRIQTLNKKYEGTYIYVDPINYVPMIRSLAMDSDARNRHRVQGHASIYTIKTPELIDIVKQRFGIDLIVRLREKNPGQLKFTDHDVKVETVAIFKEYQERYPDTLYYVSEGADDVAVAGATPINLWSGGSTLRALLWG